MLYWLDLIKKMKQESKTDKQIVNALVKFGESEEKRIVKSFENGEQ